jgi:hypothetical protein
MPPRTFFNQIAFRYRTVHSATGITRETAKRLAEQLGVDETQMIHRALHELAVKMLQQYEGDNGPLTATQVGQFSTQKAAKGGNLSANQHHDQKSDNW